MISTTMLQPRSWLLALLVCLSGLSSRAQMTFTSWVHPPDITLYATPTSFSGVATSSYLYMDDAYSEIIDLGFPFTFYGVTYSKCVIGSNGKICFDTTKTADYDQWSIPSPLLGDTAALNCICGPYCDMDVSQGGEITYFTAGTAPNRVFAVNFCHNAMFSCISQSTTTQMILHEGSNNIEVHIGHKTVCTGWNNGYAIVGVQNADGSAATTAPGRDFPDVWTADHESWEFIPDATATGYSVGSITYAPIPYYTVFWYDSTTGGYLGTGDSLVVLSSSPGNFKAVAVACADTGTSVVDTVATGYLRLSQLAVGGAASIPGLNVYPNPANTTLFVNAAVNISELTITDITGRTIVAVHPGARQAAIDVRTLPKGLYLLSINGIAVHRVMKE